MSMTVEEKNRIFKSIQGVVNSNPVIVIGCGLSMNYGLPGMRDLALAIKNNFTNTPLVSGDSENCVRNLINKLDNNVGLEDAMLSIKCTKEVEDRILNIVWNQIASKNRVVFADIVQKHKHLSLAYLLTHLIYNRADAEVNLVTTNYDCLIEYAASQTDAYVNCGCSNLLWGNF